MNLEILDNNTENQTLLGNVLVVLDGVSQLKLDEMCEKADCELVSYLGADVTQDEGALSETLCLYSSDNAKISLDSVQDTQLKLELKKLLESAQSLFNGYIRKHYSVNSFQGLDANSVSPEVTKL